MDMPSQSPFGQLCILPILLTPRKGSAGVWLEAQEVPFSPRGAFVTPWAQTASGNTIDRLDSKWVYLFLAHFIFLLLRLHLGKVMASCRLSQWRDLYRVFLNTACSRAESRARYPSLLAFLVFPLTCPACSQGITHLEFSLAECGQFYTMGTHCHVKPLSRNGQELTPHSWGVGGGAELSWGLMAYPQALPKLPSTDKGLLKPPVLSLTTLKVPAS